MSWFLNLRRRSFIVPNVQMESGLFMNVNLVIVRKGEMTPLQWYYYDGTYVEPHQGTQMNKEFVIMAINLK